MIRLKRWIGDGCFELEIRTIDWGKNLSYSTRASLVTLPIREKLKDNPTMSTANCRGNRAQVYKSLKVRLE